MRVRRAVVITLLRRRDRLDAFKERWARTGVRTPVQIVWAVDGQQVEGMSEAWAGRAGAFGCYLSHLKVLEQFDGPLLVLEDDAIFTEDFAERLRMLQEPDGPWDLLYLGGELTAYGLDARPRPGVVPVPGATRTHAYLVRDPAKVAALLRSQVDHGLQIDVVLQSQRLNAFAALPFFVGQAGGVASDIQDADREDDQYWQPRMMWA